MSMWDVLWGIFSTLVLNEFCELSPWAAEKIVKWSAHLRYTDPQRAKIRAEELAALIKRRPGKLFKLITAACFAVSAIRFAAARFVEGFSICEAGSSSTGSLTVVVTTATTAAIGGALAAITLSYAISPSVQASYVFTPNRVGAYTVSQKLEREMNAKQLEHQVIVKSAGQATHVISAVYEASTGASIGATPQMILFIGGNLSGVSAAAFISSFIRQSKNASTIGTGALGGQAACVNASATVPGSVALCTWADNGTFGVVASPTMNASRLAVRLREMRPKLEHWRG